MKQECETRGEIMDELNKKDAPVSMPLPHPKNKDPKQRKGTLLCFIAVVILIAAAAGGIRITNDRLNKKHWEEFHRVLDQFDAEFPDYLKKQYRSFPLSNDVEVTAHSRVEKLSYHDWNDWTEEITVTIHAPDSFDLDSDREIYNALGDAYDICRDARREYLKGFPEHEAYSCAFPDRYNGILVALDVNETIQIKTSENTYRHSSHLRNYYEINGKDHFIRDSASSWGAPSSSYSSQKPSGSYRYSPPSSSSDPYHAGDYATPEDFYDDNYDEFFSYEDAESYYQDHEYDD